MTLTVEQEDEVSREILSRLPQGSYFVLFHGNTTEKEGLVISNIPPLDVLKLVKAFARDGKDVRRDRP
jgi:hypothetical protein